MSSPRPTAKPANSSRYAKAPWAVRHATAVRFTKFPKAGSR